MQTEKELHAALHQLKETLDAFGREAEEMAALIPTPPLDHFQRLVAETRHRTRRRLVLEQLLFLLVATAFLGGVGLLLQRGYLLPVMAGYIGISLFLPFLIIWPPTPLQKEVD